MTTRGRSPRSSRATESAGLNWSRPTRKRRGARTETSRPFCPERSSPFPRRGSPRHRPPWRRTPPKSAAPAARRASLLLPPHRVRLPPRAPPANALDPGIPENVASAVLAALKTGTDSTQLRGFASAVAEHGFPVAAAVLTAKANTLGPAPAPAPTASVSPAASAAPVVSPSPAPSASSTPASTPSAASSASSTPASAASPATSASPAHASAPAPPPGQQAPLTYKVKSGDSPWKITAALIHDGNRWPELVAANPQKKKGKDGNFTSLLPGEVLQLPASWAPSSATTQSTTSPQGGA